MSRFHPHSPHRRVLCLPTHDSQITKKRTKTFFNLSKNMGKDERILRNWNFLTPTVCKF